MRAISPYRRLLRAAAATLFLYASVIALTGGFEFSLGILVFRSHRTGWMFSLAGSVLLAELLISEFASPLRSRQRRVVVREQLSLNRTGRRVLAAVAIAVLVFTSAAQLIVRMPNETPRGDFALLEISTLRALNNAQLVGPYSRFLWHHPGPAMFYVFRPLYEITGHRFESLRWSALLFNVACLTATLVFVRRRAGAVLFVAFAVAVGVHLVRAPDMLSSPWNPDLIVLPFALLLTGCAAVFMGGAPFLVVVAAMFSFVVQTHLSIAVTSGIVGAIAVGWFLNSYARGTNRGIWVPLAALTLTGLWLLPVLEELTAPHGGNISAVYQSFRDPLPGPDMARSYTVFVQMLSAFVMPGFSKARGELFTANASWFGLAIGTGSLLALPWAADRFRMNQNRFGAALAILSLAASLGALWSVRNVQGDLFHHIIFWIAIIGTINVACVSAAVAQRLQKRLRHAHAHLATTVILIVCLVIATATGISSLYETHRSAVADPSAIRVRQAAAAVKEYLQRQGLHRPLVRIDLAVWEDAAGIVLALQKSEWAVSIEDAWISMYGTAFSTTGREDCELLVAAPNARLRLPNARYAVLGQWPELSIHAAPIP